MSCSTSSQDRYGRSVSSCSAGERRPGRSARPGRARVNDRRYPPDRSAAEAAARDAGAGDARRPLHAALVLESRRAGSRRWRRASSHAMPPPARSPPRGTPTPSWSGTSCRMRSRERRARSAAAPPTTTEPIWRSSGTGSRRAGSAFKVSTPVGGPSVTMGFSIGSHFPATDPRRLDGGATWRGTDARPRHRDVDGAARPRPDRARLLRSLGQRDVLRDDHIRLPFRHRGWTGTSRHELARDPRAAGRVLDRRGRRPDLGHGSTATPIERPGASSPGTGSPEAFGAKRD